MAIYTVRTTANREDQVLDFVSSNAKKRNLSVYSIIHPHGMRGYIFIEAETKEDAEQSFQGVPYARGLLKRTVSIKEIESMLEQAKTTTNIQKNDIVEIISGPFKNEKAKVTRIDKQKDEVIIELLEAAVPIPITLKLDAIKVIRREGQEEPEEKPE
ncbi:transcription elongation factor Spt5 [Candidatus Woesearchaeota archaeon]|nr:transcription elongation factor Spt5 [Candidatus Woesearchaeota archaeon]